MPDSDHDRLIRVETEVHLIKAQQEKFEEEQRDDRQRLHAKIDDLTDLVRERINIAKGMVIVATIVGGVITSGWGYIRDHWKP